MRGEIHVSSSKLEESFLKLLNERGLPLPQTNRLAGGRRVDCRWPEHRLTVELDGYRFHRSRYAWEQDRRREREAYARGDEFRRYTYGDVVEQPQLMLRELEALLRGRAVLHNDRYPIAKQEGSDAPRQRGPRTGMVDARNSRDMR